ncbi:MAG: relaxase/mobilization nuclease domain-containing protein [Clostridia bacterium]
MAVTWIGSIRHARMDQTVKYAVNPVKTAYEGKKTENASMTANIAYALNPEKGTARLYQTAIHLDSPETAWREMRATKERWEKTDGILGFHVVQSFRPGEIGPELAHRIGVELVEKCFPGFEAVVGTHLDKHHLHNHIVLNSVSCLDGHKYHSTQKSYYSELRQASDSLCRKYGISVVEPHEEGSKAKSHSEWQAEKNGPPTWCSAIREDVDEVLAHSLSLEHFISHLRGLGYEVKTGVKHMAIRPPGKERFTRLRRLGDEYTEEAIRRRILENDPRTMPEEPLRAVGQMAQAISSPRTGRYAGSFRAPRKKVTGLRALYLWYAYRMGNVRKGGASACKTHYLLREDIRKLQKRDLMATLLVKNKIETISQLYEHREDCREMIAVLCEKRVELKKQPPTEARAAELDGIREKLKVLRREVRLCGDIEMDSVAIQKKRLALRSLAAEQAKPRQLAKHEPQRF